MDVLCAAKNERALNRWVSFFMYRLSAIRPGRNFDFELLSQPADLCRYSSRMIGKILDDGWRGVGLLLLTIILGSGLYGMTVGLWRSPLQGFFTAVKFPLLMLLTAVLNGVLNGMSAQVLGLEITWRQSLSLVLSSFAILSMILASMAPVTLFFLFNLPPADSGVALSSHGVILLVHVALIAVAGVSSNVHLFRCLVSMGGRGTAWRILLGWLSGNGFLGCQLSWLLRPFMGTPSLPVQFFREDVFEGNFYESIWRTMTYVFQ